MEGGVPRREGRPSPTRSELTWNEPRTRWHPPHHDTKTHLGGNNTAPLLSADTPVVAPQGTQPGKLIAMQLPPPWPHAHGPYGRALAVIAFTQIVGAVYLHANGRKLGPGLPRLLAVLPVIAFNLACPLLFDRQTDITTIVLVAFNFAWLSSFKALLWALNRSELASPRLTTPQFVALLLTPLTPVSENPQRKWRQEAVPSKTLMMKGLLKFAGLGAIARVLHKYPDYFPAPVRAFMYGLGLYMLLSSIMDGPGALFSHVLGIRVSPHFNSPWLATSVRSFWNQRWDLAAGNVLRQLIYEPVIEGRLVSMAGVVGDGTNASASGASGASRASGEKISVSRQLVGSVLTFLTSGLIHEGIFWYLRDRTSGGQWLSFFVMQVPIIILEKVVVAVYRHFYTNEDRKYLSNLSLRLLSTMWTVGFESWCSAKFFWTPAEDAKLVLQLLDNVEVTYNAALQRFLK